MLRTLFFVVACVLGPWASADTIYKCVEYGRVSYGDRPCRGAGTELNVPSAPAPDPDAQARHARSLAALQEIEKGKQVQAEHEYRDRERARRAAVAQRKRCDRLRLQQRWAFEDAQRQRGDAKEAARLKTRRQAEALALECPA